MKKRLFSFGVAVIMMFSIITGIGTVLQIEVSAADADNIIPVTAVDDINYEVVNARSAGDYITKGSPNYKKQYKFTLKKPAYVMVAAYSELNSFISELQFKITYNEAGTNVVQGTAGTIGVSNGGSRKEYLVLDAGDYYVTVWLKDAYAETAYGRYDISVLAGYSDAIIGNATKMKAQMVSTDEQNTGIITASTRNSWYKFQVSGKVTANITTWLESDWSTDKETVRNSPMAVTLWDSRNKVVAFWNNGDYGVSYTKKDITLNSGTYYLSFYGERYYSFDTYGAEGVNSALRDDMNTSVNSANYIYNGGEVNFKITTVKAPTGLKVANQSKKKAKITYKGAASAKGYEIQYSTSKKFKSGVKKLSIKGTSVTAKNLKKGKTYYVRVRAWAYDLDLNKVYSAWASKKVKIKK